VAGILWVIAVILVIVGIVQIFQGQIALGIVLIVVGLLIGPGGVSIFGTTTAASAWPLTKENRWKSSLRHLSPRSSSSSRR
jgi:hypothetical protein